MRPGRLDRILYVSPPDFEARKQIFSINFSKMAVNADVDVEELSRIVSRIPKNPLVILHDVLTMARSHFCSADRRLFRSRTRFSMSRRSTQCYERRHERTRREHSFFRLCGRASSNSFVLRFNASTLLKLRKQFEDESLPKSFMSMKNGEIEAESVVHRMNERNQEYCNLRNRQGDSGYPREKKGIS